MQTSGSLVLPALRADLSLLSSGPAEDGSPTWLIHDLPRNRYFRLGLDAFKALGVWRAGATEADFLQACDRAGLDFDGADLKDLLQFLVANQLVEVRDKAGLARLLTAHQRVQQHWLTWLIHHYLFFKVPLVRPDPFLHRTLPLVAGIFRPSVLGMIRLLGVVGLLLILQQWEVFVATFLHFWSWQGLLLYGVTLAVVKSVHELGHAYVAKRYGCKVGAIGVALLVLFPVLYTDTTDSWRLRSSRQRFRIAMAGINTELHLAMMATFAWSILPDGILRSAAFFVATTSWISSLMVNLNPFMRFDGYFALSDLLKAENLQPRSFALARWKLRELLFGLGEPVPEILPKWRTRLFILYAYTTWIYRAIIFLGIALLIYHFTFKLLGIFLFAIEIVWFILMPVRNEVQQWWLRRHAMRLNLHSLSTALLLVGLMVLLAVPWRPSISLPAVLQAGDFRIVYAPEGGRVVSVQVNPGDAVEQGAVLMQLQQPDLDFATAQTRRELSLVEEKIRRQAGSVRDLQDSSILVEQKNELLAQLAALADRQARLQLRSPLQGAVSHVERLQTGQWVSQNAPLVTLRGREGLRVIALASAEDLYRLETGATAVWVSDLVGSPRLELRLTRIDYGALQALAWPELASEFGGPIPTRKVNQQLRPEGAWYQIEFQAVDESRAPHLQQTGRLKVQAQPESLLQRYWRHAASVWIRESGF